MDTSKYIADDSTSVIFKGYAGSLSYGTNLPTSDLDIRGLFCADQVSIRTPFFTIREVENGNEEDTKFHEVTHFMKLCVDCNPNIIEMLWLDESDIIKTTPAYQLLRDNRASLLSSKIAFTTSGYAISQLKRIKGHNKWINSPQPVEPYKQKDFLSLVQNFTDLKMMSSQFDIDKYRDDCRLIPYGNNLFGLYTHTSNEHFNTKNSQTFDDSGMLNTIFNGERHLLPPPSAILKFNEQEYNTAKIQHKSYWTWKKNRNPARSTLEEKFGYDCKHAMHLVRLMRMGEEALIDGTINVKRPDAAELLEIRNGAWSYDKLLKYATNMNEKIKNVLYKKTKLQKTVDLNFAAELIMEVQDQVWNINTSTSSKEIIR